MLAKSYIFPILIKQKKVLQPWLCFSKCCTVHMILTFSWLDLAVCLDQTIVKNVSYFHFTVHTVSKSDKAQKNKF